MYRAIGLKKDKKYINDLRHLLYASESVQRYVAALAPAHINGIEELDTLRKAYAESGSVLESVLIGLGLIEIGSPESNKIIVRLRKDLTADYTGLLGIFKMTSFQSFVGFRRISQWPISFSCRCCSRFIR